MRAKESLALVTPWLLFSGLYLAFLVYTASHVEFDTLDNRLLSPLYIPLIMSFITMLDLLIRQLPSVRLQRGGCVALALLLADVVWHNQSLALDFSDRDEYYSNAVTHSSLLNYLERHPSSAAVYSNDPGSLLVSTASVRDMGSRHRRCL